MAVGKQAHLHPTVFALRVWVSALVLARHVHFVVRGVVADHEVLSEAECPHILLPAMGRCLLPY